MDGAPYRSAYLMTENDEMFLSYSPVDSEYGVGFFVPENEEFTWEELKFYVGKNS